ncbi:MAG: choice-of-anchor A family protein [Phycisphaeraceae bacterium]|nr:choice-of-anchor A family protein [Phycisphaeraceae bacterium]
MNRSFYISAAAFVGAAALSSVANAAVSYWDFNVFSRSTIGSANQAYGSDFQGASGAVGNAYFSGFAAKTNANSSASLANGFYGGGDFRLSGSVNNGGISVAGNVTMNGASITGPVWGGGNLGGSGGSVNGNVSIAGTKTTGNQLTVNGSLNTGQAYAAALNLVAVSSYFQNAGNYAASLAPTGSYVNQWGELIINASGPLSVVNVNTSDFINAWGIRVVGNGAVVINVAGTNLNFASKTWNYQNGASSVSTLLNLNDATTINMSGGHNVNILAANANTSFSSGVVTGNLIVGSLMGSGQVNWNDLGGFSGTALIPAPGAAFVIAGAGLIVFRRRR